MRTLKTWRGIIAPVVALLAVSTTGCGSALDGPVDNGVMLRVENNMVPPTQLAVYVLDKGAEEFIGTVGAQETEMLRIDRPLVGEYRLIGRTPAGRVIVSDPVLVPATATIVWNVLTNTVMTADLDGIR